MLKSNKLLLALLLPVFLMAFGFAAYVVAEDVIIDGNHYTADEWAAHQAATQQPLEQQNVNAEQLQNGPIQFNPSSLENEDHEVVNYVFKFEEGTIPVGPSFNPNSAMDNLKANLFEMFFNDGVWPPTEGSVVVTISAQTWQLNDGASTPTHEGAYGARIGYYVPSMQDEWIITDPIALTSTFHTLTFAWMTGYAYMVRPYGSGDMWVKISTNGGSTWTNLWREEDHGVFPDYIGDFDEYIETDIDLTAYVGQTVLIGFNYVGQDADGFYLDWISVNDGAAPVGRCCYGDPYAPSCVDDTQANCVALSDFLSWDGGLDCTTPCEVEYGRCCYGDPGAPSCDDEIQITCEALVDFLSWDDGLDCTTPCPVLGVGDDCLNPIAVTLNGNNYSDLGNFTCGRGDNAVDGSTCSDYYDSGEDLFYEITVTTDVYVNITVDPKTTTYAGFMLGTDCPPTSCLLNLGNSYATTPFGADVVLSAGTYYLMIDTWAAPDCIPELDLIITDLGTPPDAPANDLCADAELITVPSTGVSGTCIGATLDCPGVLDWNAVWYEFTLSSTADCSNLVIDYSASDPIYSVGVILYADDCPVDCNSYILYSAIDWGAGDDPAITWTGLTDGTYFFPAFTVSDASDTPMDFIFDISAVDCPDAPDNDLCSNAEPILTNPASLTGSTLGATIDCPGLLDWNAVWYSFEVPSAGYDFGADVTFDFCGSSPVLVTVGVVLFPDCTCGAYTLYNSIDWDACDGNPLIVWKGLTAGVYYFPAFTGPGTYGGIMQDFTLNFVMTPAPPPQPGDNCLDPVKITINSSGDLPYTDANYTCGRGNAESATCLGSYDGGEDLFYEVTLATDMTLKFTLDPQGTTWSGMGLGSSCPPAGSVTSDCIGAVTGSAGTPKFFQVDLVAGTYYLMIDTYPTPDCIPALTLTIEQFIPTPGDNCSDPLKVNLPADAPYTDNNYTCGRGDAANATCLSYYDGGEDIFYEVNVDVAGYYEFMEDPNGTTYVGMVLSTTCPATGTTYTDCLAECHGSSSAPNGFIIFLTPGTYYLMIDTWPSPACIPDFDLTINYLLPAALTYNATVIEFCNAATDDIGCTTLTLGNAGDIDLEFDVVVEFGLPASKEIDGANIVVTPTEFSPGTTADLTFICTNASSDAEWLDSIAIFFPTGVYVNTATNFVVTATPSHYLDYDGTTGDNTEVSWGNWDGGYGNFYSTEVGQATVNISFDAGVTAPLTLDYHISGDDYGSTPHDVWGSVTLTESGWCTATPIDGVIPGGGTQDINVCFNATGMPAGTYFATLNIVHNGGLSPIMIPVTLTIGPDHVPAAVLAIDRSGSMALEDAFGDSRFDRAKNMAHIDADVLINGGSQVSVVTFNSTGGIAVVQDFTTDLQLVNDAIDAIGDPRHDTPLAAAMCQAHCTLYQLGCGVDALYTYTDGEENESLNYDMCYICDACYRYHDSGWNYDCNPASPGTCTDWQLCLADVFAANGMNVVNYFGAPINPFGKNAQVPEDMFFLKYTADASDGEFNYFADAQYICGDANSDSHVNVSDAVFIINYVFVAGDAPQPLESANVNCDANVNVSDAVYLINFVFVGGPAPCVCQ